MNHDFESLVERIAAGCEHEVVYNAGDLVSLGLALKADPGLAEAFLRSGGSMPLYLVASQVPFRFRGGATCWVAVQSYPGTCSVVRLLGTEHLDMASPFTLVSLV